MKLESLDKEKQKYILLKELERRLSENFIDSLYPEEGPLRRELYKKHMEFFEAGAKYRERACISANRIGKCVSGNTMISTPSGEVSAYDLYKNGKEFDVIAFDGEQQVIARASRPFKKDGLHECYRIEMSDGRFVECADHHRILTDSGWMFVSDIYHCEIKLEGFIAHTVVLVEEPHVVDIKQIGKMDVFDFTVEKYHNYCAGGLVHHNTLGMGGYETTLHLTGKYPDWWAGRRFNHPVNVWAAGKTNETTRDIIQAKLVGGIGKMGTGLIPADLLGTKTSRTGIPNAIDTIQVMHTSGGWSELGFKSYAQGRDGFEGTERHVVWLDEEPPMDIYSECLIRTMTTNGIVLCTFTPLEGFSDVVLMFMPGSKQREEEKKYNA